MKRTEFIKKLVALSSGLALLPQTAQAQFGGLSSAGIIIVLERIWTQVFNSKETLNNLFKHAEDLISTTQDVVDFMEMKGWFERLAALNEELGRIAYYLKQLINVYQLAKEFQGQIENIDNARKQYLKAYKVALKALSPRTKATIKERIDLLKEADKMVSEGRKLIKQVEVLIEKRVDQIRRQQRYDLTTKKRF